jgi:hypothetical protein
MDITAMKATTTSGPLDAGSVHPMKGSVGLLTAGGIAAIIMSWRKVTGGRLHFNQQKKRGACPAFSMPDKKGRLRFIVSHPFAQSAIGCGAQQFHLAILSAGFVFRKL